MRKWKITVVILLVFLVLVFKLFEPIIVYNSGWTDFEQGSETLLTTDLRDDQWRTAADAAELKFTEIANQSDMPAISIAVAIDGQLVWRGATGYADIKEKREITFDHQFRIGSTSKAVTAVAIGSLYDKGLIDFNKPMGAYDETLQGDVKRVTLGQVMSQRSGIRNYGNCLCFPIWEHRNRRHFSSVRDSIKIIEKSALLFEPGSRYQYTSLGYNLAGLAAESVTKNTFEDVLNNEVFAPLGMAHTQLEKNKSNLVNFYDTKNGQYKPSFRVDNSIRWPSGGVVSTPTDLVKLGSAMLDDKLLSKNARAVLLDIPQEGRENGGEQYAYGWRVSDWGLGDGVVLSAYHHNGVAVGSFSVFVVFPEQGIVVSAMANKSVEGVGALANLVNKVTTAFIENPISDQQALED